MGRTNPTYRDSLRRLEGQWGDYRRALRHRDTAHFDRLWEQAADYADAAGYQNRARDVDLFLVSVALAQERRIADLESTVATLESTVATLESADDADADDAN